MDAERFLNVLPVFHHPVLLNNVESGFKVLPEFIKNHGGELGAYWVVYCPNGEIKRILFEQASRFSGVVHGREWRDLVELFGMVSGQEIHFYYLGHQRFRLDVPNWDGYFYPKFLDVEGWMAGDEVVDDEDAVSMDLSVNSEIIDSEEDAFEVPATNE